MYTFHTKLMKISDLYAIIPENDWIVKWLNYWMVKWLNG